MVYAVIGNHSIKHSAQIGDYQKLENPESSVGAVFSYTKFISKKYLHGFYLDQKIDVLTNCLVHTMDKNCPLITIKYESKQDFCSQIFRKSIQKRNGLRSINLKYPTQPRPKIYIKQWNYTKGLRTQSKKPMTSNNWNVTSRMEKNSN